MKRIITAALVLVLSVIPINALATEFSDMPVNWSTEVLEKAVENGLIKGSEGNIMPNENLTRAQMATILNRSFGASKEASLGDFKDVDASEWYYTEMAKAVNMKTFEGANSMLNPNDSITREQAFAVMARALKIKPTIEKPIGFKDVDQISNWAKGETYAMIEAGYIQGSNNMINPKGYVTRAEFAKLMDNIIKEYISLPGEYTSVEKGNVMVNSEGVILKDFVVEGDLIIGDGVDNGDVTLMNAKVNGRIVVRSGREDSIKIINEKTNNEKTVSKETQRPNKVVEPEVIEPEVTEPEVTEPEVIEPEVTEPKVTEPEVTEPEVIEPEVTEPKVTEPEVTEPEVIEPEVIEPEVIEPEVIEPEVITPNATEFEITSAFNHAYQENYETDSLAKIENNARNAYILLDADDSQALALIPTLKENNNVVSAYVSIGTGETWRDDFDEIEPFLVTKSWDEWSDEYFINDVNTGVLSVMKKRLDKFASSGFEWVEFDNMDWAFDDQMRREYGFNVSSQDAISYYQELARYANSIGLKVMAKNTTIDAELFDGVTYESYSDDFNWWPQSELKDFLTQGKMGLIVHYNESDPTAAYQEYQDIYGKNLLFMAESTETKEYVNFVITGN